MTLQKHHIRKQLIQLNAAPQVHLSDVERELRQYLHQQVNPKLEELFSKLSPPDEYLRIEHLELDLGDLPMDNFKERFAERLYEVLEKKIQQFYSSAEVSPNHLADVSAPKGIQKGNRAQSLMATFFYFLEFAQLPWWKKVQPTIAELEADILPLLNQAFDWQKQPYQQLLRKKQVQQRLARQFSPSFLQAFLPLWTKEKPGDLIALFKRLQKTKPVFQSSTDAQTRFWLLAIQYFIGTEEKTASPTALRVANPNQEPPHSFEAWIKSQWRSSSPTPDLPKKASASASSSNQAPAKESQQAPASQGDQSKNQEVTAVDDFKKQTSSPDIASKSKEQNAKESEQQSPKQISKEEALKARIAKIYGDKLNKQSGDPASKKSDQQESKNGPAGSLIDNAGMILIAPYLPRLFKKLDLLEQRQFKNEAAIHQAIHLLDYLCWGVYTRAEYQQSFNKILCGVAMTFPVKRIEELPPSFLEEADQLLAAVIKHWSALRSTSAAGLRQSFLQREGQLFFKTDSYQLNIKRSTIDILIDQIPWSFSMIQAPWMDKILMTDWS